MQLRKIRKLNVFLVAGALLVVLAAALPSEAQGSGNGAESLTVLILDDGESGSIFTVAWTDDQQCSAGYNVYLDSVESSSVGLPEGATVDDSGRIHLVTTSSSATQVTASFTTIFAASDASVLSVTVYCGIDDGSGRPVAAVDDVEVEPDTRRPVQGAYSSVPTVSGLQGDVISGAIGGSGLDNSGLAVAALRGNIPQHSGDDPGYPSLRAGQSNVGDNGIADAKRGTLSFDSENTSDEEETHSAISTTIADNDATGSTFTITWVDTRTCTVNYNLYMDNIESNGVGLPSGATQDSDGRVHLGAVAATTDPLQKVSTFSTVKAVSDGDHLALWIYCGDDDTGRKVESYELPIDSTSLRPVAGTYSSTPGITELQINGTAQSAFDPYKTHEEYIYIWNVGDADEATIKLVLNDGYSATYYGSTKAVYSVTGDGVDKGKFATWYINGTVTVSDADDMEDDFQLQFDDNDPNGTDMFLLSVSRGDYHTGHHYVFFIIRKATVAGPTMLDYPENGTDAIGTYTIADPDRDYYWMLSARTGEDEEDDMNDFTITKNDDGNGVLSLATSPDFEAPTDSSSPPDNVYHTAVLGWEVNPILGYWYGNYYGFLDVQVTVTDVTD